MDADLNRKIMSDSEDWRASGMQVDGEDDGGDSDDVLNDDDNEMIFNEQAHADALVRLERNEYDYEAHVELIRQLRANSQLDELRKARERMCELFAMTEQLYFEWIEDETELALTDDDRLSVALVYERAVDEYLSWEMWSRYLNFAKDNLGKQETELLIKRACEAFRFHLQLAHLPFWFCIEFYREIGDVTNDSIRQVYHELLALPHHAHQESFQRYRQWEAECGGSGGDDQIWIVKKGGYDRAVADLPLLNGWLLDIDRSSERQPHEVFAETIERMKHVKPLKSDRRSGMITVLYERDLSVNYLRQEPWIEYMMHTQQFIKVGGSGASSSSATLKLLQRAVRNACWSIDLWVLYLLEVERMNVGDIDLLFARALVATKQTAAGDIESLVQLLLVRCDIERRRHLRNAADNSLRKLFVELNSYLHSIHPSGDPQYRLERYFAKIEAVELRNLPAARALWKSFMLNDKGQCAQSSAALWLQYADFERMYGGEGSDDSRTGSCLKTVVAVYRKALAPDSPISLDYPEQVIAGWKRYEAEFGQTVDAFQSLLCSNAGINGGLLKLEQQIRNRRFAEQQQMQFQASAGAQKTTKKRQRPTEVVAFDVADDENNDTQMGTERMGGVANKRLKQEPPSAEEREQKKQRTVFVSNLYPSMTEEKLSKLFTDLPSYTGADSIVGVRLVKHEKSEFRKTFAFIEFSNEQLAKEALRKDRTPARGLDSEKMKPIYVSPFTDPAKQSPASMAPIDPKVLYVTGLPMSITVERLTEFFSQQTTDFGGPPVSVRLISDEKRLKKSKKPFAYVEFESEQAALANLTASNGARLDGELIKVDRSRQQTVNTGAQMAASLGGSRRPKAIGGRSLVISLMPRTLLQSGSGVAASKALTSKVQSSSQMTATTKAAATDGVAKSNADFRAMLFKK